MISLKKLEQAYKMLQEGKSKSQISKDLNINRMELIHKLDIYQQIKDKFDKQLEAIKSKIITADEAENIKSSRIKKIEEELREWEQKLLEREAWVKLFTKNIIYKYRVKNQNLEKRYEKYVLSFKDEMKTLKEEHFASWANLQKEIKEKLDAQQELQNYKFFAKMKYIIFFGAGGVFGLILLIISIHWNDIMGFISKIIS